MALVAVRNLWFGFRGPPLLEDVTCQIEPGQRIGLLGRNGAGKTTFMRILAGDVAADEGEVWATPGARVSLLPQAVPQHQTGEVSNFVGEGFLPAAGEEESSWVAQQQVDQILSRMALDGEAKFENLSAGMKRRVLLARALVSSPDLLLLDEPTNHLDLDAITWLEDFLARWDGTLIFVTHDRMFLRNLATRILEIDRGHLFDWTCDYDTFLTRKDAALAVEEKQNALFDKRLAQEEAWIRQGIKARRTRNEGRVRALQKMRRAHKDRRQNTSNVRMMIQEGQRSGNLVATVENISFAYGDKPIIRNFSTLIMRGDKLGIIGANGAGKTTLLRLLLGKLPPQEGTVRLGTNLQIAYFDQLRDQLREDKTVQENVADGYESIEIDGQARHVIGYLQDFLFTPERARTPVRFLSGGERNRLLLARLFAKPANMIVLDEPTNDLDTETLELLEERLVQFDGTLILVSHDRAFLNNVVTSTIVFEADDAKEYVGGYDDWLRQRANHAVVPTEKTNAGKQRSAAKPGGKDQRRRLSYNTQRELAALPSRIEELENDIAEMHKAMADPDFFQQPGDQIASQQARLKDLEDQLAEAYQRWQELDELGK